MFAKFRVTLLAFQLMLFLLLPGWVTANGEHAEVCRAASFFGLEQSTRSIHRLLGANTTDISKIKLFITKDGDVTYIQSNFLSEDPDKKGEYSENPTKLHTNSINDVRAALLNIIYWGKLPSDSEEGVELALESVEVFVDRKAIDHNGRLSVDLKGAKRIRLATETEKLDTGEITTLFLEDPPPALVETIDGCCLKGRPPGRAAEIKAKLRERAIDPSSISLLSMVVDSGTDSVISKSPLLSAARDRTNAKKTASWEERLSGALNAASGRTLLVLTHINGTNVEVLDPTQKVLFSIPVQELSSRAQAAGVDLILFGCDTASFTDPHGSIGLAGKYNTATAAKRLSKAIGTSFNVSDLLGSIASPDIVLVAYDESGGNGYAGASGFARPPRESFFRRVFRLLSIRGRR